MSKSQRDKGARAERELRRLLADELGDGVIRELGASRDGGHDLSGVGPFAMEVKRCEQLAIGTWWQQACRQALRVDALPALAYRRSRQPWTVLVPLSAIYPETRRWVEQPRVGLDLEGFALVVRELMPVGEQAA